MVAVRRDGSRASGRGCDCWLTHLSRCYGGRSGSGDWKAGRPDLAMGMALDEARSAAEAGEVPVGAVVVHDGTVVGRGHNRREILGRPSGPCRDARPGAGSRRPAGLASWTAAPCMSLSSPAPCAQAPWSTARVDRLVFGARDPKGGYCGSIGNLVGEPTTESPNSGMLRRSVRRRADCAVAKDFFASGVYFERSSRVRGFPTRMGRGVRVAEGARLESMCRGNSTVGSNPTLSAMLCGRVGAGGVHRAAQRTRRGARVVEWGGLENR